MSIHVLPADVPEARWDAELPDAYLERIVGDKLRAVAASAVGLSFAALLVADTIVVLDGDILGKPNGVEEAAALVGRLVGQTHTVYTRYAISTARAPDRAAAYRVVTTRVTMRKASSDEVRRYAQTGEGLDKAGAYAAQGIGAFLIERIEGSYTNVVGLPACEVVQDLRALGLLDRFPLTERGRLKRILSEPPLPRDGLIAALVGLLLRLAMVGWAAGRIAPSADGAFLSRHCEAYRRGRWLHVAVAGWRRHVRSTLSRRLSGRHRRAIRGFWRSAVDRNAVQRCARRGGGGGRAPHCLERCFARRRAAGSARGSASPGSRRVHAGADDRGCDGRTLGDRCCACRR